AARCADGEDAAVHLEELARLRRVMLVRIAGREVWAGVEDAGRLRDALGVAVPGGVHEAFAAPVPDPLGDVIARYARTHGPFRADDVAARFGLGVAVVTSTLRRLAGEGRVVEGELRPGRVGTDWCDSGVLRLLRRRSLAALRQEAEPVDPATLGRFLPAWQSVGSSLRGPDGVLRVVAQLAGAAAPASALESLVLPARVASYSPAWLDELSVAGEIVWAGHGHLPGNDGWVSLHLADTAPLTLPDLDGEPDDAVQRAVLDALAGGGAFFFRQLADAVTATISASSTGDSVPDDATIAAALWDLVWSGYVTNDTVAPLRSLLAGTRSTHRSRPTRPRSRYARTRAAMPARSGPPT